MLRAPWAMRKPGGVAGLSDGFQQDLETAEIQKPANDYSHIWFSVTTSD